MKQPDWKVAAGVGVTIGVAAVTGMMALRERLAALETRTATISKLWEHVNACEQRIAKLEAR